MTLTAADINSLYAKHAEDLLLFAIRRTFDAQHAVDLLGETFATAHAWPVDFPPGEDDPQSWLTDVARQKLTRFYTTGSLELCELTSLGVERVGLEADVCTSIERAAGLDPLRAKVRASLDILSLESRTAVRMRICDQLSFAAMAEKLEIDQDEAVRRVCRGMSLICRSLDLEGPWREGDERARAVVIEVLGGRLADASGPPADRR